MIYLLFLDQKATWAFLDLASMQDFLKTVRPFVSGLKITWLRVPVLDGFQYGKL